MAQFLTFPTGRANPNWDKTHTGQSAIILPFPILRTDIERRNDIDADTLAALAVLAKYASHARQCAQGQDYARPYAHVSVDPYL